MLLRDYLYFQHLTIKELAQKCEYTPQHIEGYLSGRLRISPKLAKKIAQVTNNEVTVEELLQGNPSKTNIVRHKTL